MRLSKESSVTICLRENRVYFSAKLVKEYDLMNKKFVFKDGNIIPTPSGYSLREHRSAYYVKSKELAVDLAERFGKEIGSIKVKLNNGTRKMGIGLEEEWKGYLRTDFPGRIKTLRFLMLQKKFAPMT